MLNRRTLTSISLNRNHFCGPKISGLLSKQVSLRILFFTTDLPPLVGLPSSGTAVRAQGFIDGFTALGHEVIVSPPKTAVENARRSGCKNAELDKLSKFAFCHLTQTSLVSTIRPDLILCGHWPAVLFTTKPTVPLFLDLAGPHLLERHFQRTEDHSAALIAKLNAIAMADQFIVSGPTQRLYFLSFMMRANVDHPEDRIIEIPMLFGDVPAARAKNSDDSNYPRIIFGGVFLPWQDPSFALRKTVEVLEQRERGRLTLVGGPHPNYDIDSGVYRQLFDELSSSSRVDAHPMLELSRFDALLQSSDVALDLMRWNLERELAITIRTTSYLRAGIPVIYNDYADLGRSIVRYNAGWSVGDDELEDLVHFIIDNPEDLKTRSRNATRLATELYDARQHCANLLTHIDRRSAFREEIDITLDFPQRNDLPVTPPYPVRQRFVSRINGLAEIRIRLDLAEQVSGAPLIVSLIDEESGRKIATQEVTINSATTKDWMRFTFDPIPNSSGRMFSLVLEQSSADSPLTPSIYPWIVDDSPYPLLELTVMGETLRDRSLCLQSVSLG